jgi:hypothetical protein
MFLNISIFFFFFEETRRIIKANCTDYNKQFNYAVSYQV